MAPRKKSSTLATAQGIAVPSGPQGNTNPTEKISVPESRLEDFALFIEAKYPNVSVHERTIRKGGMNPNGKPNVLYAVKSDDPKGMATVWVSGSGTLTGAFVECLDEWNAALSA